jgi:hypothetical protein
MGNESRLYLLGRVNSYALISADNVQKPVRAEPRRPPTRTVFEWSHTQKKPGCAYICPKTKVWSVDEVPEIAVGQHHSLEYALG